MKSMAKDYQAVATKLRVKRDALCDAHAARVRRLLEAPGMPAEVRVVEMLLVKEGAVRSRLAKKIADLDRDVPRANTPAQIERLRQTLEELGTKIVDSWKGHDKRVKDALGTPGCASIFHGAVPPPGG